MNGDPPDPFRDGEKELIAELQADLTMAKAWAEVWERATKLAIEFYHPYGDMEEHQAEVLEEVKRLAVREFREKRGYKD